MFKMPDKTRVNTKQTQFKAYLNYKRRVFNTQLIFAYYNKIWSRGWYKFHDIIM